MSSCTGDANDVLILPMNLDFGTDPGNQVWFQFDLDYSQYCSSGVCADYVYFLIWNNPNPTGSCGTSISYNAESITQTSPTSGTPGLPYIPGHAYEWHFYASSSTEMTFLVKDDTTGNYWYSTYTVPSLNLVYQGSCFSPSTAVETYIDSGVSSLTGIPYYQFYEGNDLQDIVVGGSSRIYGSASQFEITCDFCSASTGTKDGYSLGAYQSFIENSDSGLWYWTLFQAGLEVPVSITLSPDVTSNSISTANDFGVSYLMRASNYFTTYASMLGSTYRGHLTLPVDPSSQVTIYGESFGSGASESWCLGASSTIGTNPTCASASFSSGSSGVSQSYYYYDLLAQASSFSISGGGSPSVSLTYTTAPTTPGAGDVPTGVVQALSSSSQTYWALRGSSASATNSITGGAGERWATSSATSWTITAANVLPSLLAYYHQYDPILEITAKAQSNLDPGMTLALTGTQFGSSGFSLCSITTASAATGSCQAWVDSGGTVSFAATISGAPTNSRWENSAGLVTTQTISSANIYNTNYTKQLTNTYQMSPSNPTTWDATYTEYAVGTYLGKASTDTCTITDSKGTGVASCTGWSDYNLPVSLPASFASAGPGTWKATGSYTWTDTTGGNTHTADYSLTAQSLISVSCSPASVITGVKTSCTATVTGDSPTGTVTWSSNSTTGIFSASVCILSSGSCSVPYEDTTGGHYKITGTYSGDSNNVASIGTFILKVYAAGQGLLRIQSSPAVWTTIRVNGIPRNDWGLNWLPLAASNYSIVFTDVPGFNSPTYYSVTFVGLVSGSESVPTRFPIPVYTNTTTVVTINFVQEGTLKINTSPPTDAVVFVNGSAMDPWGDWVSLIPAKYTVSFQSISGLTTPNTVTVAVSSGVQTTVTGFYNNGTTKVAGIAFASIHNAPSLVIRSGGFATPQTALPYLALSTIVMSAVAIVVLRFRRRNAKTSGRDEIR